MKKRKNRNRSDWAPQGSQDTMMDEVADNPSHDAAAAAPSTNAIIYQSEKDYISRCILDYFNIETGGQLFGFWTSTGAPVVTYAIGPGPNAIHHVTSFVQDQNYLQSVGRAIHKRFRLQHIGEWHSHHRLGLTHPSGGDVDRICYEGVGKPGFPRLLLCIGTHDGQRTTINAYNFHENMPADYVQAKWDVIPMESPYRKLIDVDLQHMLIHPSTQRASHGDNYASQRSDRENIALTSHWLTERVENVETMKEFVAIVKDLYCGYDVKVEILPSGEPVIAVRNRSVRIKLPHGFPAKAPELMLPKRGNPDDTMTIDSSGYWVRGKLPLAETFRTWFFWTLTA